MAEITIFSACSKYSPSPQPLWSATWWRGNRETVSQPGLCLKMGNKEFLPWDWYNTLTMTNTSSEGGTNTSGVLHHPGQITISIFLPTSLHHPEILQTSRDVGTSLHMNDKCLAELLHKFVWCNVCFWNFSHFTFMYLYCLFVALRKGNVFWSF